MSDVWEAFHQALDPEVKISGFHFKGNEINSTRMGEFEISYDDFEPIRIPVTKKAHQGSMAYIFAMQDLEKLYEWYENQANPTETSPSES